VVVPDSVDRAITVDAPIERVWQVLTQPEHIAKWYAFDGAAVDLRPGGSLVFSWKEHGTFYGTVERVDRPHFFSYRLVSMVPDERPNAGNTTLVEFTLTPLGERTQVRVVESGFARLNGSDAARAEHLANTDQGWRGGFAAMRDYVTRLAA
jgi:uncharacterized protein YndB with AHSA1/START domain